MKFSEKKTYWVFQTMHELLIQKDPFCLKILTSSSRSLNLLFERSAMSHTIIVNRTFQE